MTNPWIEALRPRLTGFVAEGLALAGLAHPGIKGRLRELLIQRMIEPYLPPSVVVRTGTIVSFTGPRKHRTQDDIVLFWRERAPLLLDMEQSIMPIVGVLAQIEVKTTLTRDGLKDAVMAAEELRDLATGEAPGGLIFAYKSDNSETSEPARLLDVQKEKWGCGKVRASIFSDSNNLRCRSWDMDAAVTRRSRRMVVRATERQ